MKRALYLLAVCALLITQTAYAETAEEYLESAQQLAEAQNYPEALALLNKAVAEHPDNSDLHALLGLYTGMSAGQAGDYMEAGRLAMLSFEYLDKAVTLGPENPRAYLYRGIMGVNVPTFLGKLDPGINDLKRVIDMHGKDPDKISGEMLITAYSNLATGYLKAEDFDNARSALTTIVESAPGTDAAKQAEEQLAKLEGKKTVKLDVLAVKEGDTEEIIALKEKIKADPGNTEMILQLGTIYYDAEKWDDAVVILKEYVAIDQQSADAYKMLGISIAQQAETGYDERIASDTDLRSGMAFEAISYLDQAVQLNAKDIELRLTRGIFGIMFPFFIGKHDQGVLDLEYVAENATTEEEKAQALYFLGLARQREALRYWIEVASKYPKSEAAKMVYQSSVPRVTHFDPSKVDKPVVVIDFVFGFQDELPPQTAIWIEDMNENHIRTLYVSGFSGYAKEVQINLPVWSAISNFEGCEAVTGASIDIGHHIYTWDLNGLDGKKVKKGTYKVRVEVMHWPSGKYQLVETEIELGKKGMKKIVEEGVYIPRLEVSYIPK
jgi:tetratricopeptide (TPR) repeat protein